jgi:hypothetical protein
MINHFNNMLRHLFETQLAEISGENIDFGPPDAAWRGSLASLALNIYLVDIRENRKLRSNARRRDIREGLVYEQKAPPRIDCHYLITAWSTAARTAGPAEEEQRLLYNVTRVLMNSQPLVPSRILPLPGVSAEFADAELPVSILPVEGFPKLAEFWGTMGSPQAWKPAVYIIATLPVIQTEEISGPMVTTRITEYRLNGHENTAEIWIQIGGHVLDTTRPRDDGTPAPVSGAWVALIEPTTGERLQTARTNDLGRFTFGGLREQNYQLVVRTRDFSERTEGITVPSPTGNYDIRLS